MTWTAAETAAVAALKDALEEAGFIDGRSTTATSSKLLYFRDFIDDASLQKAATYFMFMVNPEEKTVLGDNEKIAYEVSFDCYLATTKRPENSETVTLRGKVESEAAEAGLMTRFIRSSFDPDLKLYLFQYRIAMEV